MHPNPGHELTHEQSMMLREVNKPEQRTTMIADSYGDSVEPVLAVSLPGNNYEASTDGDAVLIRFSDMTEKDEPFRCTTPAELLSLIVQFNRRWK